MKVQFNKVCVLLSFFMITAYAFYVLKVGANPPDAVTFCFNGAWALELVLTMRLKKAEKQESKQGKTLMDEAADYVNAENVEAIVEKKLGVDLKRTSK